MKTDELLKKATKRKWIAVYNEDRGVFKIGPTGGAMPVCTTINQGNKEQEQANAELTARAVNAFEPMQEALRSLINIATHPKATKAEIKMIAYECKAALALAEGEEWEVNPRWAENNQPLTKKKP